MTTILTLLSIKSIYLIIFYNIIIIIQLMKYLPKVYSVKGCVTYVYGNNYSMRQSICDKLTTHFTSIPLSLPNELVKLTINHQELYALNSSQLLHLPNLIFLNLDSNKIKFIHSNTFNHLIKLETLSLRYNLLTISYESFHPNILYGLNRLQHINLLHNPIGNIPNNFFLPISKTIRSISLSDSRINNLQLNKYSFNGLYKLQLLDLSNNNLMYLPDTYEYAFNQMQLNELYLYGNPWKCDCNLRWLKQWFIKYHKKLIYTKSINEMILRNSIDIEANNWLINEQKLDYHNDMNTLLQPKCATPIELHGKPLFSPINNNNNTGIQAIRSIDFHCVPESHTPNQQIQLIWGSNSTLSCKFFADPSGIVIWYKDGTRIQNHWPRITTKQSQGRNFLAELTIENIQNSDAGIYVCYLDTGYGHVNTTFNAYVNGGTNIDELSYHNGVFYWISKLDTTLVLKYTGMIAACLIILLVIMGLLIYIFNGKEYCRPKLCVNKTILTNYDSKSDHSKTSLKSESETMNTNDYNIINDKNTINYSKSSYTLQRQSLKICTSLSSMNDNPTVMCTRSPTSDLDDHVYLHNASAAVIDQQQTVLPHKSHDATFDNYVTVRLLPTVTCSDLTVPCPIHNYAFIHPVSTDSVKLSAPTNTNVDSVDATTMQITPESQLISLSNIKNYNSMQHSKLTATVSSLKACNITDQNNVLKTFKVSHINSSNTDDINITSNNNNNNNNNDSLNSSTYTPCPLHGNIYATLQSKDRKTISSEIRKHIANVPSGLTGVNYDKHHTLPNKKFRPQLSIPSTTTSNVDDINHTTMTSSNSSNDIFTNSRTATVSLINE
ncbi:hypothetical protein MN116_004718 [Schistosoma mekongi]|uniref:Ig-like domain-containing protein n=1 Tax=Schistosoma mekongi TaxID=38744 RepID=A0AAE1ZBT0_SCHME|nr:hypothetical protein MN116_004718 [Schistosoma mekongi]